MDNVTTVVVVAILIAVLGYVIAGFRRVPIGAVGIVISMGRRTGDVRSEGVTWLAPYFQGVVKLFPRERQIDVPAADYYTADRVRIAFKTKVRVRVVDPMQLIDQGPGTFGPFEHDSKGDTEQGSEEANLPMRSLVQNSIRETVQGLSLEQVMFGGSPRAGEQPLRQQIRWTLHGTAQRWGLEVLDVWLTDVEAHDHAVREVVQSEAREILAGRARVKKKEAQVAEGAAFVQVAMELAASVREQSGHELPLQQVVNFLMAHYQNERALDIALRSASAHSEMVEAFYREHMRLPAPSGMPVSAAFPTFQQALEAGTGSGWIVGREGQIMVESDGVSRHHARIAAAGEQVVITDLGSLNGTFVNGRRLSPNVATPVGRGDRVTFGRATSFTGDQLLSAARDGRL